MESESYFATTVIYIKWYFGHFTYFGANCLFFNFGGKVLLTHSPLVGYFTINPLF